MRHVPHVLVVVLLFTALVEAIKGNMDGVALFLIASCVFRIFNLLEERLR